MGTQGWEMVRDTADVQIKPLEYLAYENNLSSVRLESIFAAFGKETEKKEEAAAPPPASEAMVSEEQLQTVQAEMSAKLNQLRAEAEQRIAEAYQRGKQEAEADAAQKMTTVRESISQAVQHFAEQRDHYFQDVEQQVVRLSLAIAAKILHREAQMDPLLLSGAVRVALGQLSETTQVRLRIPSGELALWEEMLRLIPNLPIRPKVIGEEEFSDGDCVLETEVGTVDLGVRAQLAEIERGFFDLLEQRPSSALGDGSSLQQRN